MMKTLIVLSIASSAMAGGLVPFSAGSPAKADEVNRNFNYLDSAKAEKSAVDLLTSAVNAKAEKSALESLTKALDGKANTSALPAKADTTVWKALRDSSGSLRSAIQKLPTSSVDTIAKRRIDSLAAATKSGDAGLATRVSAVEANKMDKGTITAASIHALPDTGGNVTGSLAISKSLVANGGIETASGIRVTGSDANEPFFRIKRTDAPIGNQIWDWTTDRIEGSLFLRTIQDDAKGSSWVMKIDRNGLVPTAIKLYAPTSISGILEAGGGLRILPKQELKFGMEYDSKQDINTAVLASALADNAYLSGAKIDDFIIRHKLDESRILLGVGADNPLPGIEVSAKAVRVNLPLQVKSTEPWADYVFEPGYKTMPLKEIEAFAKANGHLPEVPSAAEVQKDGIDLAKMNAILLKKIEELTLHAVEQEKRMEALQSEVREMKTNR